MRTYGALNPIDQIESPPDSVQTVAIGPAAAAAIDWPGSTGLAGSAYGAHLVRFSGVSSGGAALNFMVNVVSTHAAIPSSGSSITTGTTAGSTGNNLPVAGTRTLQIPGWSTGWSAAAPSSGYVLAEVWRK